MNHPLFWQPYPFSMPLRVERVLKSTQSSPWSSRMSASLGQALRSCSSIHRMLCTNEFSYREFSIRPNTGIMQRFLKGEIFSISSRSRLERQTKKKNKGRTCLQMCLHQTHLIISLTNISFQDSLFLQAHRPSEQHLQEAFEEPLAALVDVQLVCEQREAVVLEEFLLLLLEGSAEIGIQQLGERGENNRRF